MVVIARERDFEAPAAPQSQASGNDQRGMLLRVRRAIFKHFAPPGNFFRFYLDFSVFFDAGRDFRTNLGSGRDPSRNPDKFCPNGVGQILAIWEFRRETYIGINGGPMK